LFVFTATPSTPNHTPSLHDALPISTAVYVSNIPSDITTEEIEQAFSKFGVIAEDLKTGEKKIRLYKDDSGNLKGDALVIYFKPEDRKSTRLNSSHVSISYAVFCLNK